MILRNKRKKGFLIKRLFLLVIIGLLVINAGGIGRLFFSFPFRDIIINESKEAGIDPFLIVAVMRTESGFDSKAVSVEGARGLMQIMPDTGEWIAGKIQIDRYNRELLFYPEINIKIGVNYLANLDQEYKGDQVLMLAAYNAGRGNVNKWLEEKKWNGERESIGDIPFPETRQFILKVLLFQQLYEKLYSSEIN
ncbi:MAG: lytic transglycosylase domain-containing protein [Peptococcaceae bacterium]|nr:lytic transglycosylase domain-containing protein [Peptococcaceae bacterium]